MVKNPKPVAWEAFNNAPRNVRHVRKEVGGRFERYNIVSEDDKLDALQRRQTYLEGRDAKSNVVTLRAANSDKDSDNR